MCVICVVCALCLVLIMKSFCCRRLVDVLHQRSVPVYLISGGLRGVITPVALELNIPLQNIYANRLKFFFNGKWLRVYFEEMFLSFFLILSVVMFAKCVFWSLPMSWFFSAISVSNPTKICFVYSTYTRLYSGLRER